jgi:hypothetical protein
MKKKLFLTAAGIILTSLLCLYIFTAGHAEWLAVETPSHAVPGNNFKVKIELKKPEPGLKLGVDLHHMNNKKESLGCLSVSRSIEVTDNKTLYEFTLPVPVNREYSYIFPVITLSKDGSWAGRIKAAESEPIPIILQQHSQSDKALNKRRTYDIGINPERTLPESDILCFLTASLWVLSAIMLFIRREKHGSVLLPLTATAAAVWEIFDSGTVIVNALRNISLQSEVYNFRRMPQQFLTIIIILACSAVIIYMIYNLNKSYMAILVMCLILFWSISLLRILSLHEIDRLLTVTIAGIQTGQLIRLSSAALSTAAFLLMIKKRRERH